MTTPTKEQIQEIRDKVFPYSLQFYTNYTIVEDIITEWEKIRNSPK